MTASRDEPTGLSPWWRHATILVMIAGFSVLALITVLTYTNAPPIPARVTDAAGATLFDRSAILHGQEVFLKYGLMEHGTLWGHGAYLGPDYTAEYLHRLAEICSGPGTPTPDGRASDLKRNRYDPVTSILVFSPCEASSLEIQGREWEQYFRGPTPAPGLPSPFIKRPSEDKALTAYFAWATWATVANRPGKDYSYTNNWPYEPLVGNRPSSSTYLWSALSLITLLSGIGAILFLFGRFDYLGWGGEQTPAPFHETCPCSPNEGLGDPRQGPSRARTDRPPSVEPPPQPTPMVLVSIVTAASRAKALPHPIVAPVVRVMAVAARIFPSNEVVVPRVAELPTTQNTPSPVPAPVRRTDEPDAVVSVLPIWNTKTALLLP